VSLFVWLLPFGLSGLGVPAGSYATAGIALGVTEALKLPHHVKVETPSGEGVVHFMWNYIYIDICETVYIKVNKPHYWPGQALGVPGE